MSGGRPPRPTRADYAVWRQATTRWADVDVPVLLFRAERMHDGAIQLEPNYAHIDEDGGWGAIVSDLTIVHLPGDHLAVVDEPAVGIVGKHMNAWIEGKR